MAFSSYRQTDPSVKGVITGAGKPKKPAKPKKKVVKPQAGTPSAVGKPATATYGQTNTIQGSKRFGQNYRTIMTAKGAVHEYKSGERVLLKGKKGKPRSVNV